MIIVVNDKAGKHEKQRHADAGQVPEQNTPTILAIAKVQQRSGGVAEQDANPSYS
jgi:hypothetical protein